MKHSISCVGRVSVKPQKRKVASITVMLTLETQDEFDRLVDVLGNRYTPSGGNEFLFYRELADLHRKVIIGEEKEDG